MKLISFAVKFRAQMTTSQKGKTDNSLQHYGYVPTIMGPKDNFVQKTQML
jgi:hypothetical protein